MLVGSDVFHPNFAYVIERSPKTNRIGDVAGPRLKTCRRWLIHRFLECDVGDHIAAALPRRHAVKHIKFSVDYADSRRPENFVPGEYVEVAPESLDIHRHMGDRLSAIDDYSCAVTVRHLDHLARRRDCSERVRHLAERYNFRARTKQFFILFENDFPTIIDRGYTQASTLFRTKHLPGDNIRVMLEPRDDDLIALANIAPSPSLGNKVDAFRSAAHKNDFAG